jgi:rhamnosyltransferase subunit B
MGERVLLAAYGSAGDLFPLVPVGDRLARRGHDVCFVAPRAQALLLRSQGRPVFGLGSGDEREVMRDPHILTTRFDGWASWHRVATGYVGPSLDADVEAIERVIAGWRPDLVVTMSFATAARVAAARAGLPQVRVTIYPQHVQRLRAAPAFGRGLTRAVRAHVGPGPDDRAVSALVWGAAEPVVLLHDPALLDGVGGAGPERPWERGGWPAPVGFPSWDGDVPAGAVDERIDRWLRAGDQPVVMVTLGSFLGACRRALWTEVVAATRALGVRALLVGWPGGSADQPVSDRSVMITGYAPHATLMPRVSLTVHHGGIGTTFAAIRSGCPAVILPQAFDQSFNGRLIARHGVGVDGGRVPVAAAIERLLSDGAYGRRARALAGELIPADTAADAAADAVLAAAGGTT